MLNVLWANLRTHVWFWLKFCRFSGSYASFQISVRAGCSLVCSLTIVGKVGSVVSTQTLLWFCSLIFDYLCWWILLWVLRFTMSSLGSSQQLTRPSQSYSLLPSSRKTHVSHDWPTNGSRRVALSYCRSLGPRLPSLYCVIVGIGSISDCLSSTRQFGFGNWCLLP